MPALIRANDLSFDFLSLTRYSSFCIHGEQRIQGGGVHWNRNQNGNYIYHEQSIVRRNGKLTWYLSSFLRCFSIFFIDAESLPSSPSWYKIWGKTHNTNISSSLLGGGGYKPIVKKKIDSNKPQPKWYKSRNPSNRKERCGQSRQPVPCSTINQISLFLKNKKNQKSI